MSTQRPLEVSPVSLVALQLADSDSIPFFPQAGWCLLADGVVLLPETDVTQMPEGSLLGRGLRRITVEAPWACAELQAAAAAALAEVGVPFLAVSGGHTFNLFVPEEKLGRALAALRQARLDRFRQT